MLEENILEPQIEATLWVNNITYPVKLSGEVRLYLDCVKLNKAIIREHYKPAMSALTSANSGTREFHLE